jgi:hypothetical protein
MTACSWGWTGRSAATGRACAAGRSRVASARHRAWCPGSRSARKASSARLSRWSCRRIIQNERRQSHPRIGRSTSNPCQPLGLDRVRREQADPEPGLDRPLDGLVAPQLDDVPRARTPLLAGSARRGRGSPTRLPAGRTAGPTTPPGPPVPADGRVARRDDGDEAVLQHGPHGEVRMRGFLPHHRAVQLPLDDPARHLRAVADAQRQRHPGCAAWKRPR